MTDPLSPMTDWVRLDSIDIRKDLHDCSRRIEM